MVNNLSQTSERQSLSIVILAYRYSQYLMSVFLMATFVMYSFLCYMKFLANDFACSSFLAVIYYLNANFTF